MIDVPPVVRNEAQAAGALEWLRDLPSIVDDLGQEWGIEVGRVFGGATEAYVAEATLADGTPAVLKLVVPRPGDHASNEITVLELAAGDGCARLLRSDRARSALLLERLGPSLAQLDRPLDERLEILCAAAEQVWRPVTGCGLPTGAERARSLAAEIAAEWEALGRPCSERAVADALACAERRATAHDDGRAVLVHGDVHQWNALESPTSPGGFKLVDPDGLVAEPEFDLGVMMREDLAELLDGDPRARSRWLAARCRLDEVAIWEWGVIQRVSNGLRCTAVDLQPAGRLSLAVADAVARSSWQLPG